MDPEARADQPDPTRTRELLEAYLRGDRASERRLFDRHRDRLIARAQSEPWMAGLSQWVEAEDLVDEVLLRALSSGLLARFEGAERGELSRLLSKMLDDVAVDTYRRHGARKRGGGRRPESYDGHAEDGDTQAPGPGLPDAGTTPTGRAREHELVAICREVLGAREWEVWHRCEVLGHDSLEVGRELEESPAAIRGVLRRARLKVFAELDRRLDGRPE